MRRARDSLKASTTAWIRAVAAFVALLVAGDHALASFHQALTAHEVCAEHGELVHTDSTHLGAVPHGSGAGIEQGAAAEAEHHHCGAVPAAPNRAPVVVRPLTVAAPALVALDTVGWFENAPSCANVLAYEPKQSPPA